MSITHNNPIVNPQSKPTRLAPGKINPNDAKMAALCFTIAALACCISLGVIQPILSICVIAGVVPMAKLAPETGGPEAPKAAGYFAFPIGLSDCEYVGKIQTEPPLQRQIWAGKRSSNPRPLLGSKSTLRPSSPGAMAGLARATPNVRRLKTCPLTAWVIWLLSPSIPRLTSRQCSP